MIFLLTECPFPVYSPVRMIIRTDNLLALPWQ